MIRLNGTLQRFSFLEQITRFSLVALAIATVTFSSACSKISSTAPQAPQFSGTSNDRPLQNQPARKETPIQIQREQPKSIEQQAQEVVLRTWLNLWNSEQKGNKEFGNNFVNIKITNANNEDVINKKGILTNSLNTNWLGGLQAYVNNNSVGGFKYTGEAQIDKIKVNASGNIPTSDADKANGLQWRGRVSITYIIRYHAYYYSHEGWSVNSVATEKWLHSKETNAFPNLSPWFEESVGASLMLNNGKLEITQFYIPDSAMVGHILSGLELPSKVLTYGGQIFGPCSYEEGSPCRKIKVDPPK